MQITKHGIYHDVPTADYFADPCPVPSLTQSIARVLIERSPAHARLVHPRMTPPGEPDESYVAARAIGDAAHKMLLGRGKEVAVGKFADWRTKEAQAFKTVSLGLGKTIILEKHLVRATELVSTIKDRLEAAGHERAFQEGHGEVVLAWQEDGIWFRCMVDWMVDTCLIYDLKTTAMSVAPHVVIERPSTDGWDIQAAMFERGLDALDPESVGRRSYYFVAVENEAPFGLVPVLISEADLTMGRKKLAHAIAIWRHCITNNRWPCYPPDTITSHPRGWTETRWLEREVAHEEHRQRGGFDPNLIMAG